MKLILSLVISAIVAIFVITEDGGKTCNQMDSPVKIKTTIDGDRIISRTFDTPPVEGRVHEGTLFEVTVPSGWDTMSAEGSTTLAKNNDPTMNITFLEHTGSARTLEDHIRTRHGWAADSIEKATIGQNTFIRLVPPVGVADSSTLLAKTNLGILTVVAGKFNYPEILTILGSIKLKP